MSDKVNAERNRPASAPWRCLALSILACAGLCAGARAQEPAPAGDGLFTGSDPAIEQTLVVVRELAARSLWVEAYQHARRVLASADEAQRASLYATPGAPGLLAGLDDQLFGPLRAAPPDARAALRALADTAAAADRASILGDASPEELLAAAHAHPLSTLEALAVRDAADRFLEAGRGLEARAALGLLARVRPRAREEPAWRARMALATRGLPSDHGPPVSRLRLLGPPVALPAPESVRTGAATLEPSFLAGGFLAGGRIGLALPQGISLLEPGGAVTGGWASGGPWKAPGTRARSRLLSLLGRGDDAVLGRAFDFPAVADGGLLFVYEGVRVLPEETRGTSSGLSRRLVSWTLDGGQGEPRPLWRRSAAEILGDERAPSVFFHAQPVACAGRVWVVLAVRGRSARLVTACLDARGGDVLWRRFLCAPDLEPRTMLGVRVTTFPARGELVLGAEGLWVQTNCGLVAGLDPLSGRFLWAFQYPRRDWSRTFQARRLVRLATVSSLAEWPYLGPPVEAGGRVVFAPWDSPLVLAVPAAGGPASIAWNAGEGGGAKNLSALLGARGDLVLLGFPDRVAALDAAASFAVRWMVPGDSLEPGGFFGEPRGRAVSSGSRALFATDRGIYLLDLEAGRLVKGEGSSHLFGWSAPDDVRLFAAGARLVAAAPGKAWVFETR